MRAVWQQSLSHSARHVALSLLHALSENRHALFVGVTRMPHQPTTARDIAITNVSINADTLAPLSLKYPAGLLMTTILDHLTFVRSQG